MNFDRVASIYDATRTIPEPALEQIAGAITSISQARRATQFLEIGVGTGRVALPVARRGVRYIGVDISEQMMDVLRTKATREGVPIELIRADVTDLPIEDASADVVLAVHILHLVEGWRKALDEARRVLKPGGWFLMGSERGAEGAGAEIRAQWATLVRDTGTVLQPRYGSWGTAEAALDALGCYCAVYRAARWMEEVVPLELMEATRRRTFSASWVVPDDVLEAVHGRLLEWGKETYGDITKPRTVTEEFQILATRFPH